MMDVKVGRNAPCPCGSGRKFKQCCGVASRRASPAVDPRAALSQAAAALQRGNPAGAAAACRGILNTQPNNAHAHYVLGLAQRALGDPAAAAVSVLRALDLGLSDAAAHYHYGQILLDLGRVDEALAQLERAVALKPDFVQALGDLGNICYETDRFAEAETWYRRAVAAGPHADWVVHHNLAHALAALQRTEEARTVIDRVIALAPDRAEPHAIKAMLYELDHRLDEARASATRALELESANSSALTTLAKIERRAGNAEAALAVLERADPARMTELQKVTWHSEKGRLLDRLGRYGSAFAAFTEAAQALARYRRVVHRPQPDEAAMDRIEAWFARHGADRERVAADVAPEGPQPVFVLGFLRSGTTLVEQILGSHPEIAPIGETGLIAACQAPLEQAIGGIYPEGLDALGRNEQRRVLNQMRDRYLGGAAALMGPGGAARLFVDKSPLNSRHIGLVRLLFPAAPVLHVVRHPLDTVLSSYFENFLALHAWSYALPSTARMYARVHAHMKAMAPLVPGPVRQVRYERLVAEPEAEVRGMLSFLGVDWNPRCLKFYESDRAARTASYEQVTRPIYNSSVERYRNYLPHIDVRVVDALRGSIEDLGYTVART